METSQEIHRLGAMVLSASEKGGNTFEAGAVGSFDSWSVRSMGRKCAVLSVGLKLRKEGFASVRSFLALLFSSLHGGM